MSQFDKPIEKGKEKDSQDEEVPNSSESLGSSLNPRYIESQRIKSEQRHTPKRPNLSELDEDKD